MMTMMMTDVSPALGVVIVSTVAMFAVALTFLLAADRLRRSNARKAAMWERLEARFAAAFAEVDRGGADDAALHASVRPTERLVLIDYLYKRMVQETDPARRAQYARIATPYLPLLEQRARNGDVWQRARAVRSLAELAGRGAAHVIVAALDDAAPHVALTAARAYAHLRIGGVEPLLERIERYLSWDRRLLRAVLVSFGNDAAPALHRRMADRAAPAAVRAVCADALAVLGYHAAADDAAAALRAADDFDLMAASLRLLRAPATPAQRQVVRELCTASDDVLRSQAVACLARIGSTDDALILRRALDDSSAWVARSARLGLAARGDHAFARAVREVAP